jgi:hypothetical protein
MMLLVELCVVHVDMSLEKVWCLILHFVDWEFGPLNKMESSF